MAEAEEAAHSGVNKILDDHRIGTIPDSDPLHASASMSSLDAAMWSACARQPRALVFRKGDMNMLAVARMPRRLSEWEWVSIETLQAMPVEAQDAVRSAQSRQTSILGCASDATMNHSVMNALRESMDFCVHVACLR